MADPPQTPDALTSHRDAGGADSGGQLPRRASEERQAFLRLQSALEIGTVGVTFLGPDYRLTQVNEAFCRLTGFTREELTGMSWKELTPPEFHARTEKAISEIEASGGSTAYEKQLFRKDGSRWWALLAARKVGNEVVEFVLDISPRKQAEERLAESEARFRQFAEASSDVLWIVDARTRQLEYLSPAYEHVWGEPREAVMADLGHWIASIHPDDLPGPGEGIDALLNGRRFTAEYRITRGDGGVRYIHDSGFPLHDEAGRLVRVAGIAQDLTDRRAAEEALRRSEERFRLIIENAREHAISTLDREGRITDWLPGAQAVFGWTAEEVVGSPVDVTFTPEDRAAGEPEREQRQAGENGSAPNVRWHMRKDGGRVFIEGVNTVLRDAGGDVRGFLKIGQDVTEQRLAEQRLSESERRARTLVEGLPQLVWRSLDGGHWTWASPQWTQFTGQAETESHGLGWMEKLHPDDRQTALETWAGAGESGGFEVEYRISDWQGGHRWFHTRARAVRDEAGHISEWLGTSTDVDESRRLQRHERLLLAELQHRVRNTLGVVRSIVRRTAQTSNDVESMSGHLQGRLSAFSRVQTAITRNPDAAISLGDLIEDEFLAHATREGEAVRITGPTVLLPPRAAEGLSLAIHELTSNAVKYGALGSEGARLVVTWEVTRADGAKRLKLTWQELGLNVPPDTPRRQGFGLELLERQLPYELDAETRAEFLPTGFRFTLAMPLSPARSAANL